jgi:hypothetical protein
MITCIFEFEFSDEKMIRNRFSLLKTLFWKFLEISEIFRKFFEFLENFGKFWTGPSRLNVEASLTQ